MITFIEFLFYLFKLFLYPSKEDAVEQKQDEIESREYSREAQQRPRVPMKQGKDEEDEDGGEHPQRAGDEIEFRQLARRAACHSLPCLSIDDAAEQREDHRDGEAADEKELIRQADYHEDDEHQCGDDPQRSFTVTLSGGLDICYTSTHRFTTFCFTSTKPPSMSIC